MWFKRKTRNRRLGRSQDVLEVKLRSSQVQAARTRLAAILLGVTFGSVLSLYVLWRSSEWLLNRLVYENSSFAIQEIDVVTDGVISPDQLRRWSGVKPGENLLALDLMHVKRELELMPAIQSASVERILPGSLRIRVEERVPVAQVNVPRPRAGGGIELVVFQMDASGSVMLPLDPRQRAVPLNQAEDQLPVISGINLSELQPGRKIESPQTQAALELIDDFAGSPLAGIVELKRIDISAPDVLVVTTGQGSEVTLGLQEFEQQLLRWREVQQAGARMGRVIASLDLAVSNNVPVRWADAGPVLPAGPKTTSKTLHKRKKDV
ncbi:MAG: FtsQ-type POTRA domain-containing protein [Verrucomicrobiota bacterium]